MDKIEELMNAGWDVFIECKGAGRAYEMTYEATMKRVDSRPEEVLFSVRHAVGDTIEELAENLKKEI